jgi:acetyl esterase/lipase
MRVRLTPRTDTPARRARGVHRRSPVPPAVPATATAPVAVDRDLAAERRLRHAGGPRDRATYACTCGYVFDADVSTSVACPHCGTGQAW